MRSLFLAVLVLSLPSWGFAAEKLRWNELTLDGRVETSEVLKLENIELPTGTSARITDVVGLDMIQVVLFVVKLDSCATPDRETEMEIVLPEGSPEGSEIGVELHKGCELRLYVENKDLFETSVFLQ